VTTSSLSPDRPDADAADPTTADTPERRERRRIRVRSEIAAAAIRLATERGYDHVTVDDIAAEVDMAPRTFFRYFASKDDVLFTDRSEKLDRLRAAIEARPATEAIWRSLREALVSLACTFEDERDLSLAKSKLIAATPSLAARAVERQTEWQRLIAAAVATRLGVEADADLRAQVVAGAAVAAMQAAYRVWIAGGGRAHLPDLVTGAFDLFEGGLQIAST
jgi:AcrR family transcriptional regulator